MKLDWLIVGAGFSGSVLAERLASQLNQKVLIVERRNHAGGNAYDYYDEHGILIHKYGPHIFHTNSDRIWHYLSTFTRWRPYYHKVHAVVEGHPVPVPFNLNSIYALFPPEYARTLEQLLLDRFAYGEKVPIIKLRSSIEGHIKVLADYVYKYVFSGYTLKQWGLAPEELAPSVTARVPVYISRDNRYFQDTYQGLPLQGYTKLFERMLDHPNIKIMLNTDYREIIEDIKFSRMIYTGPIDAFFDHVHGELPYRSLRFELQHYSSDQYQDVAQTNYPNDYAYTRITEFKHMTGQNVSGTTVAYEYPEPYERGVNEPYYPIPTADNSVSYKRYFREVEKLNGSIIFVGRLADYKYYNMDQAVGRALSIFTKISENASLEVLASHRV